MKTGIITTKQLGLNCWRPERFIGGECPRLERCKYPEKRTCKAFKNIQVKHTVRIHANGKDERGN